MGEVAVGGGVVATGHRQDRRKYFTPLFRESTTRGAVRALPPWPMGLERGWNFMFTALPVAHMSASSSTFQYAESIPLRKGCHSRYRAAVRFLAMKGVHEGLRGGLRAWRGRACSAPATARARADAHGALAAGCSPATNRRAAPRRDSSCRPASQQARQPATSRLCRAFLCHCQHPARAGCGSGVQHSISRAKGDALVAHRGV